ncbi:MAG TPA: aminoglycoside 6'-N-acetyltransferase [Pyrinomonadaceae bacterium]|nr:aminoglycoside 6'-N-acetyltransferase [Pyrinomonadaceae bacterium]
MAGTHFAVRPVRESDLNEWFRLRNLLWDENADDDHRAEMMDILGHPEMQLVLVADSGEHGKLIGFLEASIRPFVEDCETDSVGYLEGWYVEPDYRKKGVGGEMVKSAERWAKQKGCTEMASDAEVGNDLSLTAHSQLGYAITSRLVHLRKELG